MQEVKKVKPSLEFKHRIYHKSDSRLEKLSRAFWGVADMVLGGITRMIALLQAIQTTLRVLNAMNPLQAPQRMQTLLEVHIFYLLSYAISHLFYFHIQKIPDYHDWQSIHTYNYNHRHTILLYVVFAALDLSKSAKSTKSK